MRKSVLVFTLVANLLNFYTIPISNIFVMLLAIKFNKANNIFIIINNSKIETAHFIWKNIFFYIWYIIFL